jgi:type III secretion system FlhB-like substrate exporter
VRNMKKQAVAVKYEKQEPAPKIIAKGNDHLADLIVKIARENNIFIEENDLLSKALMHFDVGDYIPEEMFEIVAKLLAFVYTLKQCKEGEE